MPPAGSSVDDGVGAENLGCSCRQPLAQRRITRLVAKPVDRVGGAASQLLVGISLRGEDVALMRTSRARAFGGLCHQSLCRAGGAGTVDDALRLAFGAVEHIASFGVGVGQDSIRLGVGPAQQLGVQRCKRVAHARRVQRDHSGMTAVRGQSAASSSVR